MQARRFAAWRCGLQLSLLVGLVHLAGCMVSSIDLDARHCPCAAGWTCDTRTDLCSRSGTSVSPSGDPGETRGDAGVAADAMADARVGAGDDDASADASEPSSDAGADAGGPVSAEGGTVFADAGPLDAGEDAAMDRDAEPACTNALLSGERLYVGEYRCSSDGVYQFGLSSAGVLELRREGQLVWVAETCCAANQIVMQLDGNLVARDADDAALFASNTEGNPGAWLSIEVDGRAVIWLDGRILWSTDK